MRIRLRPLVLPGVLALTILACTGTSRTAVPTAAATGSAAGSLPPGEIRRTLTHAGMERSYILYVPAGLAADKAVPLVFVFHGGTGNAASAIRMSGFNAEADRNGFLVAYPNGTNRLGDDFLLTWNGGNCCGYAQEHNIDDTGFVRAVAADIQSIAPVDPARIYATGMSNGGILSQRLGCEAADLFAAIAPVAGTLNYSPCQPSQPISVIEFHGTADEHVPYDGGYGPKSLVHVDFASVEASIGFWSAFDVCGTPPQTETFADVRHDTWTGCSHSTGVELYTIIGGAHAWPGGSGGESDLDAAASSISATRLIWEFFSAHSKAG